MSKDALGRILDRYEIDMRIVESIAFNPRSTIEMISKKTGLSYTAIRNSLQHLVESGVVKETQERKERGHRGRPAALFRLDRGLSVIIPPRQFLQLSSIIVEQLIDEEGPERVEKLLTRAAKLQAQRLATEWKKEKSFPKSISEMIDRICDYLNEQGCFADHQLKEGFFAIRVNNCIFGELSKKYPGRLCHYHYNLINHLLQPLSSSTNVNHETSISKGDLHCHFIITV